MAGFVCGETLEVSGGRLSTAIGYDPDTSGFRTVQLGPDHPYVAGGFAFDTPGVGFGQNDLFVHQARAFLDEVARVPSALPPCATFDEGVHNREILGAVTRSATVGGATVPVRG